MEGVTECNSGHILFCLFSAPAWAVSATLGDVVRNLKKWTTHGGVACESAVSLMPSGQKQAHDGNVFHLVCKKVQQIHSWHVFKLSLFYVIAAPHSNNLLNPTFNIQPWRRLFMFAMFWGWLKQKRLFSGDVISTDIYCSSCDPSLAYLRYDISPFLIRGAVKQEPTS